MIRICNIGERPRRDIRQNKLFVGSVALVAYILVGCGESDQSSTIEYSDQPAVRQSISASEERSHRDQPGEVVGSAPPTTLLTADDLPSGWSEVSGEEEETGNCLDALTSAEGPFGGESSSRAPFAASEVGPVLLAAVTEQPASEVLPAVDDVLAACDGGSDAAGFTTTVEAATIEGLREGAVAVRGTQEAPAGGSIDFVVASDGTDSGSAMVLVVTPLGDIEDELVATAISAMVY